MVFVLCPFFPAIAAAYTEAVENISVEVKAAGRLPPPVAARMEKSIVGVAEQILLGESVQMSDALVTQKENIIREVFDKILVGYSVERVAITPGRTTLVGVRLIPWNVTIRSVAVNTTVEGMSPEIEAMVRRDLAGVEQLFADIYVGMPLLAADWTQSVLKRELNDFLAEHLPEFRGDFDFTPTHEATVNLSVYPKMPTVRSVRLFMRSDTVPNFALLGYRDKLLEQTNKLVGVPVGFIKRHEGEIAESIAAHLDGQGDFRALGITSKLTMDVGEELAVTCRSDSDRFRFRIEGRLDIGRKDDDNAVTLRAHLGRKLSTKDELFVMTDFGPAEVDFDWSVGYGRDLSSKTTAAFRYYPDKRRAAFSVSQTLLPKLTLRYERNRLTRLDEWGIGYRLHDFSGIEYIMNRKEQWVRLIGNF